MFNDDIEEKEVVLVSNLVNVSGIIIEKPVLSHNVYGENFYNFKINVRRLSDVYDEIPVMVSERLLDIQSIELGNYIEILGQLRSYNNYSEEEGKNKLILTIFAKEIHMDFYSTDSALNTIEIKGYICKKPIYRVTPFGREICDVLVAVNRNYNKSDYIPCISWGRNAKFTGALEVGTKVSIIGRIQSRSYQKRIDDLTSINKMAYEVSVSRIEKIKD
ncbi:MAG: single-stranded DNA-binding protein [Lachnospirales bacterium]